MGDGLDYAENGGLFYMVASLLILAIYYELLAPDLNDLESNFLKRYVKREIKLLLVFPLILMAIFWLIKLLSLGFGYHPPPYFILYFFTILTMLYNPTFGGCPSAFIFGCVGGIEGDRDRDEFRNVRGVVIFKSVVVGYFFCHLSLFLFLFAIFGPFEFDMGKDVRKLPSSILFQVNKNGELRMVNMSHGYLTNLLYNHTPDWFLFTVMFYVSQIEATASFRAFCFISMWLLFRAFAVFDFCYRLLLAGLGLRNPFRLEIL